MGPHMEQKCATLADFLGRVSSWNSRALSGSRPRLNWSAQRNSKRALDRALSRSCAPGGHLARSAACAAHPVGDDVGNGKFDVAQRMRCRSPTSRLTMPLPTPVCVSSPIPPAPFGIVAGKPALGLLNRQSRLYREKQGRGGYTGARWDTASDVRRWVAELECVPHMRYGIFLPSGSRLSRLVERVMRFQVPWGGFLAVEVFRSR